jgi:hypothetical protein
MAKLKQFDKTTIFKLKSGDRFYFLSDSKKTTWQVEGRKILTGINKKTEISIFAGTKKRTINKDKQVVFLRNTWE